MANSKSWIERIVCKVNGTEGQGAIDVYVFVRCPTFYVAQGWYYRQCGTDRNLVQFLEAELPGHLNWQRSSAPE